MNNIAPVARGDKLSQIVGRINPILTNLTDAQNKIEDITDTVDDLLPDNIPDFTLLFENGLI